MANKELRSLIKNEGFYLWQIADEMNIHETTLVKKLRKELSDGQRAEVMSAVERLRSSRDTKAQTADAEAAQPVMAADTQPLQTATAQPVEPVMGNIQPTQQTAAIPPYDAADNLFGSFAMVRRSDGTLPCGDKSDVVY